MRKKLSLIAALIAFFAMTAVSFANNTANINVTSEPITYHALCDKAGGISLSFDHNTTFVAGDQITADLPLNVSLCKDIDFVIGYTPGAGDAVPYTQARDLGFGLGVGAPVRMLLPPVGTTANGPITGDGAISSLGAGVAFWVHGSKGSQRIFIDVVTDHAGDGFLELGVNSGDSVTFLATAGAENTGKMVISFLDQKTYGISASNLYRDANLILGLDGITPFYASALTLGADNTLCIDVHLYDYEYVKLSFDSKLDKYTWVPSDPQVAHVVAASSIGFAPCIKRICGKIIDPSTGSQGQDDQCRTINNEGGIDVNLNSSLTNYAGSSDGYCPETHRNNKLILQETSTNPFNGGLYQVQLEILVNGVAGDQGAYFAGQIATLAGSNSTDVCAFDADSSILTTTFYDAAGGVVSTLSAEQDCSIAASSRAVRAITGEAALFNGTDDDFLWVDIPDIVWDRTLFTNGETLSVRVTLIKSPCGVIFQDVWCVGTLGCTTVSDPNCFSRIYPYFGKDNPYLNIFGITNPTDTDGTYNVTIYEKDGDVFTATVLVGAHKISAVLLHDMTVTATSSAGGGTFGDDQSYIKVSGNTTFEGIIYVTNSVTGQSFSGQPGDLDSCMH